MKSKRRIQYFAGIFILLLVVAFVLAVFSMLGRSDKTDLYLADRQSQSYGWSYEVLADGKVSEVTPAFLDEYTMVFPMDAADAVKITRVFTEEMAAAALKLFLYGQDAEVFLDGELLYSDFQGGERNEAGFLIPDEQTTAAISETGKTVQVSLPYDYVGKEVSVITYFGGYEEGIYPVYPLLVNDETGYANVVTDSVLPMVGIIIYAFFAVLLTIVFVLDMRNKGADIRWLMLALFFMLLFLKTAYNSIPGSVSMLAEHVSLEFLSSLYMVPLYLYLVWYLKSWRKYLMSAGLLVWFLAEMLRMFYNVHIGELLENRNYDVETFLLLAAMAAAICIEYFCYGDGRKEKAPGRFLPHVIFTIIVIALRVLYGSADWEGNVGMYLYNAGFSIIHGNCTPVVSLITDSCAVTSAMILLLEFIQRTIRTHELVGVLEERSRLIKGGYDRMLEAEEATNAVRHELRHHMTALMGMLQEEEIQRACGYISSVMHDLEALPVFRYSRNVLVNVVAGVYLDKAQKQGIAVEYNFMLPEKLGIADEDISMFLTNMLENALQACERMRPDQNRYIRIRMQVNGNFLYIECENSMDGEREEIRRTTEIDSPERKLHGFGLKTMGMIAEKYGSILKIQKEPSAFSVRTNLCMKKMET